MKQSEFIQEMIELEDKIKSKDNVLQFAELLVELDDVGGEIEGILFLLEERKRFLNIDKRFGESTLIDGDFLLKLPSEEIEERMKNKEDRMYIEKAKIIYRFADIIKPFGYDTWTPEIKAKFERGLKYLEKLVKET